MSAFDRMETAIRFIDENFRDQPNLERVASEVGLAAGLVDYKIAAIDESWSGLLFTRRKGSGR